MSTADQIAVIAAAIALGSAVVSVLAIYVPWRNTHDSEVFKEAVLALERAYRSLMSEASSNDRPEADRLNWLTSARHIESYKSLRNSLKTRLYSRLCQQHEEHWRHEFYLRLLKDRIYQVAYFEKGPIEPRSAIVIYGFAAWPNKKQDPIDLLDLEALFQESELLKGNYGLQQYLAKFPQFGGEA
ncbi:hypothetical protein [Thiobacillus sp.]|uniref:hypothetical protein n=1 Tax=Thiobacillus sp. TaxID=924 RepID=UPI0025D229CE|nr:hypothetical protein [Thiobacillus sp.]MBT9538728.1 hypothetical protein [Thiobacillus sp.]